MSYAEGTTTSAAKTRMEIEIAIHKYAGTGSDFTYGQSNGQAAIQFSAKGRKVRFVLPLPNDADAAKVRRRGYPLNPAQRAKWVEDETKRRWRCLLLAVKAKFEVVDTGIETFDEAFLANLVAPNGVTIWEYLNSATAIKGMLLGPVQP